MDLNVEITSKLDGDRLSHERSRQLMIHVISKIEWVMANPDRKVGDKFRVECGRLLNQQQLNEIAILYRKGGWQVSVGTSTNALDRWIDLT